MKKMLQLYWFILLAGFVSPCTVYADIRVHYTDLLPYTINTIVIEDNLQPFTGTVSCYGDLFSGEASLLFQGEIPIPVDEYQILVYFTEDFYRLKIIIDSGHGRSESISIDTSHSGNSLYSTSAQQWIDRYRSNGFRGTRVPVFITDDDIYTFNSEEDGNYSPEDIVSTIETNIESGVPLSAELILIFFYSILIVLLFFLKSKRIYLLIGILVCTAAVVLLSVIPFPPTAFIVQFTSSQTVSTIEFSNKTEMTLNNTMQYKETVFRQIGGGDNYKQKYYRIIGYNGSLPLDYFPAGDVILFSENIRISKKDGRYLVPVKEPLQAWVYYE